jgi:hypothetical protein
MQIDKRSEITEEIFSFCQGGKNYQKNCLEIFLKMDLFENNRFGFLTI